MSGVPRQIRCAPQLEAKNILFSANSIIHFQPALHEHNHFLALKNSLETSTSWWCVQFNTLSGRPFFRLKGMSSTPITECVEEIGTHFKRRIYIFIYLYAEFASSLTFILIHS